MQVKVDGTSRTNHNQLVTFLESTNTTKPHSLHLTGIRSSALRSAGVCVQANPSISCIWLSSDMSGSMCFVFGTSVSQTEITVDSNSWICHGVHLCVTVLFPISCFEFSLVPFTEQRHSIKPNFSLISFQPHPPGREREEHAISAHLDRQLYLLFSFHKPIKERQLLHQIKWKTA